MNETGSYPVINGGINPSGYTGQYNQEANTITVSQGGASAGYVNWIDRRFWAGAHCYVLRPNKKVLNRFLYHFIKSKEKKLQECQYGAGIPALAKSTIASVSIPVPSLETQERLVNVLDNFDAICSDLSIGLPAEIEARRKQYEYYRDLLLTFAQTGAISSQSVSQSVSHNGILLIQYVFGWAPVRVGDICDYISDFTAAGSFASNAKNVKYIKNGPGFAMLVRTTDLKNQFKDEKTFVYVDEHAFKYLWRVNLDSESLIMPNVGNCGEVYYITPEQLPWKNNVLGPNAILVKSSTANMRFLYHLFQGKDFQNKLAQIVTSTGQTKFNKTSFKELVVSIPSLEVQNEIVVKLDRFAALCSDLSSGIPAEIEARRKQYEYYRDKLLTFKEKAN